jgi:hypothetical protein
MRMIKSGRMRCVELAECMGTDEKYMQSFWSGNLKGRKTTSV